MFPAGFSPSQSQNHMQQLRDSSIYSNILIEASTGKSTQEISRAVGADSDFVSMVLTDYQSWQRRQMNNELNANYPHFYNVAERYNNPQGVQHPNDAQYWIDQAINKAANDAKHGPKW